MGNGKEPLISVIMACYNAAPYVGNAVSSVLGQTCKDTEIIVVDDESTDNSTDIVERLQKKYPGRVRLEHMKHSGPYPARNKGLTQARGHYIAFLDADDWWRQDCLEKLHTTIHVKQADLVYCGWQNIGEHIHNSEPYIPPAYEATDTVVAFLKGCPWPIHAALVKRSVLEAVGGFSEKSFSSMDYDLWLRILAHTANMVRLPEVLAYYRWHGSGQISSNRWKQVMDAVQARRDFVKYNPELVKHLTHETLRTLVDGHLLREAYRSYWSRDLLNAQKLFRAAFIRQAWHSSDLKYLIPALLPTTLFKGIVKLAGRS